MTPENLAVLKRNLEAAEGRVPYMYLDSGTPAWVTCGVGHRLATLGDALRIPFWPAHEIPEDFRIVSAARPGMRAESYVGFSKSRLSDAAIDTLLDGDIAERIREIRQRWPRFEQWPDSCQLAVADMVFNLGLGRLNHEFPKFSAAVDRENWSRAAEECNRPQLSVERNSETKALLLKGAVRV